MKNIIKLAFVVFTIVLCSCKKDYTCTCKYDGVSNKYVIYNTKGKAKDACEEKVSGGVECSLK